MSFRRSILSGSYAPDHGAIDNAFFILVISQTLYAINRAIPENTVARSLTRTPSNERLDRKCCWQRSRETHRARLQRGDSGLIGTYLKSRGECEYDGGFPMGDTFEN